MAEEKVDLTKEFTVTLALGELNTIFGILAEGPFKVVSPIMNKIQTQVTAQSIPQPTKEIVENDDF
jgi:hypothetical protein